MQPVPEGAAPEDFTAIAAVNLDAYQEFSDRMTDDGWKGMQANLGNVQSVAGRSRFLVVRSGGGIVGSVAYCPSGKSVDPIPLGWASILLLAVRPDHRGCGIGRALTSACLALARSERAEVAGLFTSELMTAAQRLYEGPGFRRVCEIPRRHGLRYFLYRLELM